MKAVKTVICIIICAVISVSCSSSRHLKDLMLAEGMGVDLTNDGKISVTLQALNVGISNASETPQGNMTVNTDADGDTVSSALSSLGKKASKRIFFGQNKIIVLGRELAESDMEKYIDFFYKKRRCQRRYCALPFGR